MIDTTYFIGDINIPLGSRADLRASVDESILLHEPIILKRLLGYKLHKEFMTAYSAYVLALAAYDPDAEPAEELPVLEERFYKLIYGEEFTFIFEGVEYTDKWNGLLNTDKKSLIAYYVYYKHRRAFDTYYTGSAEAKSKNENSISVNGSNKLVKAYNSMVDLYGEVPRGTSIYSTYNLEPSAYNYLLSKTTLFPTWEFTPIYKINSLNF